MSKLIFCFDGTCNDPKDTSDAAHDGSISNILKMHAFLGGSLRDRERVHPSAPEQRSFYYSGIGTYGGWIRRKINATLAPTSFDMMDWDLKKIIDNAAKDLRQNFQTGDEVYIFGFSRGAAIARKFAAKIKEHCPLVKSVRFLGVFDTVAAIKGSRDLDKDTYPESVVLFEDGNLGEHVEEAVHLVAIDEKRVMFQPTLFNKDPNDDKRITEVWFAGVHSDIGGGYWYDGLSDIALQFMMGKCQDAGLQKISLDDIDYAEFLLPDEDMTEEMLLCKDDLEIIPIVGGELHAQSRIGNVALAARKLRVMVNDKISQAENDVPIIHHTVAERFRNATGYRPAALRGARYTILQENGHDPEVRHGISGLRE